MNAIENPFFYVRTFPKLPQIVRDVAEDGLEGEDEAHPLVPRVTYFVALLSPAARRNRVQDLHNKGCVSNIIYEMQRGLT